MSSTKMKPMLASKFEGFDKLKYPVLMQPKYDGIRALVIDGVVVSRTLKPIPNRHVQRVLGGLNNYDGELIVGDPNSPDVFTKTMEGVMSEDGEPDFKYFVFDRWDRVHDYRLYLKNSLIVETDAIKMVPTHIVKDEEEAKHIEDRLVKYGYEGAMVRSMDGPYKFGRSTAKEGLLLKVKRFLDADAVIVGVECLYRNNNEATKDALGHTERSTKKDGMVPDDLLGKFLCSSEELGVPDSDPFGVGTGFNLEQRKVFWEQRYAMIGKKIRIKYQGIGSKGDPRFPVFMSFLSEVDKG